MDSQMCDSYKNDLFIKTPLIESIIMKDFVELNRIFLKLENTQPSGSFKLRGISRLCQYALKKGYKELVTSSGGNAGLSVAYVSRKLGINSHIIVPKVASQKVINVLMKYGATVEVFGETSADVNYRALELTQKDPNKFYVHPFDHPLLWSGHSTIIDEIAIDLNEEPAMIISCCGGGGLLCGIIEGMRRHKWTSIPVIAMETTGTASFNACVKSGGNPVTLENFNGIAVSLSPVRICDKLAQYYREAKPPILSYLVEDKDAIDSCLKFADNHRFLVEPACGAALSAVYTGIAKNVLELNDCKNKPIVVIVCGGCSVSIDLLNEWKNKYFSQE